MFIVLCSPTNSCLHKTAVGKFTFGSSNGLPSAQPIPGWLNWRQGPCHCRDGTAPPRELLWCVVMPYFCVFPKEASGEWWPSVLLQENWNVVGWRQGAWLGSLHLRGENWVPKPLGLGPSLWKKHSLSERARSLWFRKANIHLLRALLGEDNTSTVCSDDQESQSKFTQTLQRVSVPEGWHQAGWGAEDDSEDQCCWGNSPRACMWASKNTGHSVSNQAALFPMLPETNPHSLSPFFVV